MEKKKKPEIRFEGFTDDWEQRKLGEITELKSASRVHKEEWTTSGIPFYRSSDVMAAINGTKNEKAFISEELYEKLSDVSGKLEAGDVLITGGGSVGNPYIVPDNEPLYTKDADLLWIKNQGKFYPYFLYEFFFSPIFRNYLASISHVGTIAHYTITQLSDTPICLPSFEEQKKVGEYFQALDHLITLHQRKYEKLKNLKKSMLKKMFPQKGCKVPGIRFSGFTDDWEQRKLLLICDFEKGRGLSKDNIDNNGKYPCILYGQLFTDYGMFINTVYSKSNIISEECKLSEKGDILIPRCDTTPDGLGRASVLALDNVILGFDINILKIKNKQKYDSGFVSVALNHHKKDLLSKVVGSTVRHLENKELRDVSIEYPNSLEEQKKVGEYFQALDHLITLHQRELEKLKNIKKTLLEKMF